jgi:protein involved in polysaccharide export with SLBB domain
LPWHSSLQAFQRVAIERGSFMMRSERIRKVKGWLAAILAIVIAFPVPVGAQVPPASPQVPSVGRETPGGPTITILEPQNGVIVTQGDQGIVISYQDPQAALDLSTFRVSVNGADRTGQFQVTPSGATWRPQGIGTQPGLTEGRNIIAASIKNVAGVPATASSTFVLDTSARQVARTAPLSPLEQGFLRPPSAPFAETGRRAMAGPSISRDLVQFGYETFRALLPALTPATNLPVSPDYTLGPGDRLILYVWNIPGQALYDSVGLAVDRTGSAFVPRVGSVPFQGLTLAQAQEVLRARLARYYSGFELRLALGELRGIEVYVVGEVARPGTYTISPFSLMLDALFAAGGVTKMGTLRAVRIIRNGRMLEDVDLYDFLLRGERAIGPTLQTGDTIFVPPIGPVAAIAGEVKRPGIYELRPGTSILALIAMAGGPLPTARLDRVQVERIQGAAGKVILDFPLGVGRGGGESELLRDGDLVAIFPAPDRLDNVVSLEGFVRAPGQYEWKPGMRLSDLLKPEMFLPEAYRTRIEIIRVKPDFTREVIPIDVRELWSSNPAPGSAPNPAQDIILQPLDRISVQSEVVGPARVTLSGEVKRPGVYFVLKGERLSSVIRRAGGLTEKAYPKAAIFTRESVRQKERVQLAEFAREQEARLLAESAALAAGAMEVQQASGLRDYIEQRRALLRLMLERAVVGRVVLRLDDLAQFEGSESDIPLEDGDALSVPIRPSTVLVAGSVRNPTAVLYQPGAPAEYYLERVGGLTKDADTGEVYILKADGSAIRGYTKVREMEPGDAILAPSLIEAKYRALPFWRDIATIFGQFGLTAASIVTIFK